MKNFRLIKVKTNEHTIYYIQRRFLFWWWVKAKELVSYHADTTGNLAKLVKRKYVFGDEKTALTHLSHMREYDSAQIYYKQQKIFKVFSEYYKGDIFVNLTRYTGNKGSYYYAFTLDELKQMIDKQHSEPIVSVIA